MQVAERLDRSVDQALASLPVGHVVGVGDGLAAHRLDLVDDLLGRGAVVARPVDGAAEVVDDDLGAFLGEEECMLTTDAAAGAGDDGDASVKCSHGRETLARVEIDP